jgi:hypothetical protein
VREGGKKNQQLQKKHPENKNHKNTTVQCLLLCCSILIYSTIHHHHIKPSSIPQYHKITLYHYLSSQLPVSRRITTTNEKKRNKQRETEGDETDRSKGKGDRRRRNQTITVHRPLPPGAAILCGRVHHAIMHPRHQQPLIFIARSRTAHIMIKSCLSD